MASSNSTWVFGYGSLIWRPSFPYAKSVHGFIRGWNRRFWQGSTDHRGVPGAPGRVVTVVKATSDMISDDKVEEVLAYLDHREKGGYSRFFVDVWARDSDGPVITNALLYTATEDNEEYLGPAPIHEIAFQIYKSVGPSGPNYEYLLKLASSLRAMDVEDEHIFEVEKEVQKLIENHGIHKDAHVSTS